MLRQVLFIGFVTTVWLSIGAARADNALNDSTMSTPSTLSTDPLTLVLLGDSLVAGYGLGPTDGLAPQIAKGLSEAGHNVNVINAGVSGDTTRGGLERVNWIINDQTDIVIIVLGGNDAMRAIEPAETRRNLEALLTQLNDLGVEVLLTGMRAPPNLGPQYAEEFEPIYPALAEKFDVALYPFILEHVAADPTLNQEDGIHPNAEGVKIIVSNLLPYLTPLLTEHEGS